MNVKSKNFVYETLPPFMDNRNPADKKNHVPIVVGLRVAVDTSQNNYQREIMQIRSEYALDKAQEMIEEKTREFVKKHLAFIRGLTIEGINDDGRELTFDELCNEGPPEIASWVSRAIMSTTELSMSERKNFLPE